MTIRTPPILQNSTNELKPYGSRLQGRGLYTNDEIGKTLDSLKTMMTHPSAHQSFHALTILRAVDNLRSLPAPANTFVNNSRSTVRCLVHSGFEIVYDINRVNLNQTDIHIIDIRFTNSEVKNRERAGLWDVKYKKVPNEWEEIAWNPALKALPSQQGTSENPIKVGINGYCDDIRHAANMLPSHIARGKKEQLEKLEKSGYYLFWNPSSSNPVKAGWTSMTQMSKVWKNDNQIEAAQILAAHMLEAHKQGLTVEWTSHRGGSFVLTEAMKILQRATDDKGQRIDLQQKQRIFLSDHTTGHAHADQARRALNMDTKESPWYNTNPMNLAQQIGGLRFGADELACSVNDLLHYTRPEQRPGKAIAIASKAVRYWRSGNSVTVNFGVISQMAGLTAALAATLVNAVASNIPSLNEEFHRNATQPVQNLANRVAGRLRGRS